MHAGTSGGSGKNEGKLPGGEHVYLAPPREWPRRGRAWPLETTNGGNVACITPTYSEVYETL